MARRSDVASQGGDFFKKEDVADKPLTLTIKSLEWKEFENKKGGKDTKRALYFEEDSRVMICGPHAWDSVAIALGEDPETSDDDTWIGRKVEVFNDLSVVYGNNRGGVRARAVQNAPAPSQAADNGQYWGEAIASRFGEYVKKTVPETTDKTLGGRIQRIGDKLGERGWPDLGTNPAKWPLACKDSAKACADELAAEIVAKPEEDDDSVPF